jgi:predicted esterase
MNKLHVICIFSMLTAVSVSAAEIEKQLIPSENEYTLSIGSYDWGAASDKVVICTGNPVFSRDVSASDFSVDILANTSADGTGIDIVKGHRRITDAYICTKDGRSKSGKSSYIAVELHVSPGDSSCSPYFTIPVITSFNRIYGLRIENEKLGISITKCAGIVNPLAAQFTPGSFTSDDITLAYTSYEPQRHAAKAPLIIWLHGITGGGKDPYIALFDSKTVSLITPEIQKYFPDGTYILVPQCPTGWLETTEKDSFGRRIWEPVDPNGMISQAVKPVTSFLEKIVNLKQEEPAPYAAVSYYTNALKALIDDYIAHNPAVDADRIYIGGDSAGGYMTLNMCMQYPDFFAASFTASEAHLDSKISSSQINKLAGLPMWFIYARNDRTMKPETHAIPTIDRLRKSGARNLHVSAFDDVHDTSGLYMMTDDEEDDEEEDDDEKADSSPAPYQYDGHLSWIYLFNDECRENGVSLFSWLSQQKRTPSADPAPVDKE